MSTARGLPRRGEEGATLIFVIGFMVIIGLMTAGLVTQLASSSKSRLALDNARNKEYAADGAIETDIGLIRQALITASATAPNALDPCPGGSGTFRPGTALNNVQVQVDCSYPAGGFPGETFSGLEQRDVIFTACIAQAVGTLCPPAQVIIQAQVNFASPDSRITQPIQVSKTYIQSWSVKL